MNTTSKTLVAVAIALNIAAIATVTGMVLHPRAHPTTVDLGRIVVTPADSDSGRVNLGTILVTPSDADWRYAKDRGVQRPAIKTIALGAIVVKPTAQQLAEIADARIARAVPDAGPVTADVVVSPSLVEALASFAPGNDLDTSTVLWALDALVFVHSGG